MFLKKHHPHRPRRAKLPYKQITKIDALRIWVVNGGWAGNRTPTIPVFYLCLSFHLQAFPSKDRPSSRTVWIKTKLPKQIKYKSQNRRITAFCQYMFAPHDRRHRGVKTRHHKNRIYQKTKVQEGGVEPPLNDIHSRLAPSCGSFLQNAQGVSRHPARLKTNK